MLDDKQRAPRPLMLILTMNIQSNSHVRENAASFSFESSIVSPKKSPLVLIADEDENRRETLGELLDLWNIRVLEAASGEETIDLIVRERPDLVLLDTELPRLDGFETTRLIRNIKSLDATPIIFLSTRTERASRKKAFAVGADSFHIAPLDLERLDNILENFLFGENRTFNQFAGF